MKAVIKYLLLSLHIVGLDPFRRSHFANIRYFFMIAAGVYLFIPGFVEIIWNFEGLATFVKIDLFPTLLLILVKSVFIYIKRDTLCKLISSIQDFWPSSQFGGAIDAKVMSIQRITTIFVSGYFGFSVITILIFILEPILKNERRLPLLGYQQCDTQTSFCYEIQHMMQCLISYLACLPIDLSFDCLFLVFISQTYCSLEICESVYKNLDMKSSTIKTDLKDLVDQHNLILRFIEKIDSVYSNALMIEFLGMSGQLIFSLYMLTSEGLIPPPLSVFSRNATVIVCVTGMMFIFCCGGTILTSKGVLLTDTVYGINWWDVEKDRNQFGRDIKYIVQVAQRNQTLTIGKAIPLDLETYVMVLKVSFQIYTLFKALDERQAY